MRATRAATADTPWRGKGRGINVCAPWAPTRLSNERLVAFAPREGNNSPSLPRDHAAERNNHECSFESGLWPAVCGRGADRMLARAHNA